MNRQVETIADICSMTASDLISLYSAPDNWWRANMVISFDGHFVDALGSSRGLSSPEDLRVMLSLRAAADCVVVGGTTLRSEKYIPGAVHAEFAALGYVGPRVAIVTRTFDIPDDNPALTGDSPLLVLADSSDIARHELRIAHLGERISIVESPGPVTGMWARQVLAERDLTRVLCEGGPQVVDLLRRDCALDEMDLTISPVVVGNGRQQAALGTVPGMATVLGYAKAGDHTFLRCIVDDRAPTLMA